MWVVAALSMAEAADKGSEKRVGGHVGIAVPVVTIGEDTAAIGDDFLNVGLTPGITVHLGDGWAVDFEFIAFNRFMGTLQPTTFVVDPGIVRKLKGGVAVGGRIATEVGATTNIGLVPIVVFPVAKVAPGVKYFGELDLPVFFRTDAEGNVDPSLTVLLQTGFSF